MTINIISKSDKGVVVATDGLKRYEDGHCEWDAKKHFQMGPYCCLCFTGSDGFVSKKSARQGKPYVDRYFRDLHRSLHQDHPNLRQKHLSPERITDSLIKHTKRIIAERETHHMHQMALLETGRESRLASLDTMIFGYDPQGRFYVENIDLPSRNNLIRRFSIKDNDFVILGTGRATVDVFQGIMKIHHAKLDLINLIKTSKIERRLKNRFLDLIDNFSKSGNLKFIYQHDLENQRKFFETFTELMIFLEEHLGFFINNLKYRRTIGGKVRADAFSLARPLESKT